MTGQTAQSRLGHMSLADCPAFIYDIAMKVIWLALSAALSIIRPCCASSFNYTGASEIRGDAIPLPAQSEAAAGTELRPKHAKNRPPAELPDDPLIVVHATAYFDESASAKAGVDAAVAAFKAEGRPVIYMLHEQTGPAYAQWYTEDRSPDYEIFSAGGENNLPLRADSVTVAGGFFGSYDGARGCQTLAVRDAIRMHFEYSDRPFTVNMPLRAIFFYKEDRETRNTLLALPKDAPAAEVRKVFEGFEDNFFLVGNFQTSTEDAMGFGHPFFEYEGYPGGYRAGEPVDTARYSFELFFNGLSVSKFGGGPRKVSLKMYN